MSLASGGIGLRTTGSVPRAGQQSPIAYGSEGMISAADPIAARVGIDVLESGGNAVDAAIAVASVENVTLPAMCGLGGDVFAIVYEASTGRCTAINGSGVCAYKATPEYFLERGFRKMPISGLYSAAVPGAVHAYETIANLFATRPLGDLLQPAIEIAGQGFILPETTAGVIAGTAHVLGQFPTSALIFMPGGRSLQAGDRLRNPDLAESLRLIASGGSKAFYEGDISRRIADFYRASGNSDSGLTEAEFADHETEVYAPISTDYRGYQVHQTRPVSQGLIVLEELNLLEGFDLRMLGRNTTQTLHIMIETKKLAFADRLRYCGDPRTVDFSINSLISKEFAALRRRDIDHSRALGVLAGAPPELLGGDTTYFAVADRWGNAVSIIHSLSNAFGSGVVAGDTGIVLNNRAGRGFTLEAGHPNRLAGGKRTMHTLNCYLITNEGKPVIVGGTPGGDQQPQWNMQTIVNLVDFDLNVQEAAEAPRWYSFPSTDPETIENRFVVRAEQGISDDALAGLTERGHRVERLDRWGAGGGVQLIAFDHHRKILLGGTDPRVAGMAIGY